MSDDDLEDARNDQPLTGRCTCNSASEEPCAYCQVLMECDEEEELV
jgi:hypothetical protein